MKLFPPISGFIVGVIVHRQKCITITTRHSGSLLSRNPVPLINFFLERLDAPGLRLAGAGLLRTSGMTDQAPYFLVLLPGERLLVGLMLRMAELGVRSHEMTDENQDKMCRS